MQKRSKLLFLNVDVSNEFDDSLNVVFAAIASPQIIFPGWVHRDIGSMLITFFCRHKLFWIHILIFNKAAPVEYYFAGYHEIMVVMKSDIF